MLKINNNLNKRIISALIMIPIVIFITYLGGWLFNLTMTIIAILIAFEAYILFNNSKYKENINKYKIYIILYATLPAASLISLKNLSDGVDIIIYLFFIAWITDIAAYFGGKGILGPKLAPKISPNKTISGSLVALVAIIIFSATSFLFTENISLIAFINIGICLSITSQIGDLFESWVKRKLEVKDSGDIIPGHGGICDRLDGLIFMLPVAYLIFTVFFKNIF